MCLLSCLSSLCQSPPRSLEPFFRREWLLKETRDPQELCHRRIFEFSEESELCANQISLRRQQKNWDTSSSSKHHSVTQSLHYSPNFFKTVLSFSSGMFTWFIGASDLNCLKTKVRRTNVFWHPSIHPSKNLSVCYLSVCVCSLDYLLLLLYFVRQWSRARFEGKQLEMVLRNDVRLELFLPYEHIAKHS